MASRWDEEAGFSLVEVMVASFVLLVGMVSVLGVVTQSIVHSRSTRTTDLATQLGNEEIESYRSFAYDSIGIDQQDATYTNAGSPTDIDGNPVFLVENCDGTTNPGVTCPLYREQVTRGGQQFTITRTVVTVDDPADGTGSSDADNQPQDYKRVIINVSWDGQRPGTQRIQTNIRPDSFTQAKTVRGVRFEVRRPDADGGDYIDTNDDTINFPVEVKGAGTNTYTNESIEGIADVLGIPPGAYQCVVHAATPEWHPADDLLGDSDTQPCTFNDNVVTVTSRWVHQSCQSSANPTTITVGVHDANGTPVLGATVQLINDSNSVVASGAADASGEVVFNNVNQGPYTVTAAFSGVIQGVDYVPLAPVQTRRCFSTSDVSLNLDFLGVLDVAVNPSPSPAASACPTVAEKAVLCVWVTNLAPEDRYFRLEIEPEHGDKFYVPAKEPLNLDDKQHAGTLIPGSRENYLLATSFDPQKIKKVKLELRKTKGNGDFDWKEQAKWEKNKDWTDAAWDAGTTHEFSAEVN